MMFFCLLVLLATIFWAYVGKFAVDMSLEGCFSRRFWVFVLGVLAVGFGWFGLDWFRLGLLFVF